MANITLPEPFASIPRESFLFGPSPIQQLPRMSKELGGNVNIYAKREDCNSGLAYGGNKTRKLEYVNFFVNPRFNKTSLTIMTKIDISPQRYYLKVAILSFPSEAYNPITPVRYQPWPPGSVSRQLQFRNIGLTGRMSGTKKSAISNYHV